MNFFKYLGLFTFLLFSFYYTEKYASITIQSNTLYKEIDSLKQDYYVAALPAVLENDYIVPGLYGVEVNVKQSYYNMKALGSFNEKKLIYQDIIPNISLNQHLNKIVKHGNRNKKAISFILENDSKVIQYFFNKRINSNLLIDIDTFKTDSFFEQINNDYVNFNKLDSLLINNNLNNSICIVNNNIRDLCIKKHKCLIEPVILSNNSFYNIKNNIQSGDIILIKKGTNISNIQVLIDTIRYKDLNIVYVSDLIKEKQN